MKPLTCPFCKSFRFRDPKSLLRHLDEGWCVAASKPSPKIEIPAGGFPLPPLKK